jgi:choice-of-anchor B domain-containing protein
MTRLSLFFLLVLGSKHVALAQDTKNITLLDQWFSDTLTTNSSLARYSGCWGFTSNGKEYAVIGSTEGTHFFHITQNTLKPAGFVEGKYNSSFVVHREFKEFGNYGYAVCDEGNSSLQIINLTYLPDSVEVLADLQDERFGRIHNLFIDSAHSLLFAFLVTPIVNNNPQSLIPLRVFSIADPLNPTLIWEGPEDIAEVHDGYVRDGVAFLNCGQDGLRVYDFTVPSSPIYLNNLPFYQDQGYNHQGWLSPNGKTYVFADETSGKRIKKVAVGPGFEMEINYLFGTNFENNSVPHNLMCSDELAYCAYYNEGLRIYNIEGEPVEIAHYDTYQQNSPFNMNGAWGVFAGYTSNHLVVSDRQNGLFLFDFNKKLHAQGIQQEPFGLYPNPVTQGQVALVRSVKDEMNHFNVQLFDAAGKCILTTNSGHFSFIELHTILAQGVYTVHIRYQNYLGDQQVNCLKLMVL